MIAQPDVGPVIIVGHSAGAMQAAHIASTRSNSLAGIVLLATSTKTGRQTLEWQTQQVAENLVPRPVTTVLDLFGTSVVKQQRKTMDRLAASTEDTMRVQFVPLNAKWMREFAAFDPSQGLTRVAVPTIAISGSKDIQADPEDAVAISQSIAGATSLIVKDVDHLLRHEPNPHSNPKKYRKQAQKPIDPRVLEAIHGWIGGLGDKQRAKERGDV